ncbi:uncharacterized protein DUF222 [Blastococcus saxobsidens]|uniref:Uncharacterized protein DUF222 n=1 Tax=Blastococcus saxobsidens TaxID=138336 RepID=A0A4Q7YDD6_9ACTN|nr:uncharacterized protein DUF222 [Blastococcus saxobsidens]
MDQLDEALDALAAERIDGLYGPALLDHLAPLLAMQNRLAAEVARTVRQCELAGAAEHDGKATMASWLRGHARLSATAANQLVRNGRTLAQLPAVASAAARGEVSPEAVAVIAPVVAPDNLAAAEAQGVDLAGVDETVAEVAATRPHAELRQVVGHYLTRLDPDGPEPDPTEQRSLTMAKHADGSLSFRGELDAVGGEKFQAALESIVQASRPAGDTRTRAQQSADALVQLCDNQLAAGTLPILRTAKPHVVVTIPLADLMDPATGPATARTGFGAAISAARARWLACDGGISRIVIGPDGHLPDLGRTHRVTPPHLRRGIEHRDRGCGVVECAGRRLDAPAPTGATSTTSCTGPTAARPNRATSRCCANGTTPRSTTASGWNETPTAGGAPGAPTAPRSCSCPTSPGGPPTPVRADSRGACAHRQRAAASRSALRSSGGRCGQEAHVGMPAVRSTRQHEDRRTNRRPATSSYRGAGSGGPTAETSGAASPVARSTSPTASPSASSRLATVSVAIAHSGRSRMRPASATAAVTAPIEPRRSSARSRDPPPAATAAIGWSPGSRDTDRSASRAESGMPATRPASAGVSSADDTEYHHTVARTRRSVVRCTRARAARSSAVQPGSASTAAGTTLVPAGTSSPRAPAPGMRPATAVCSGVVTRSV